MMAADEPRRCFPIALRCLPTYLDVLHVNCARNLHVHNEARALYDSLGDANRDRAWTIDINELAIAFRPLIRDISRHFAFTRNVVRLVLTYTQCWRFFGMSDPPWS
jgi:hypothetical protein